MKMPGTWMGPLRSTGQRLVAARQAFDARAPRERVLLGAAVLAALFMLADALWLGPATKAWQSARHELRQAQAQQTSRQADAARAEAQTLAQRHALRQELAALRQRVRDADGALKGRSDALVGPDRMVPLLEQLLVGHDGVRVRAMKSLPRTDLLHDRGPAAAPAAPAADANPVPSLYRHGVELTLEGSFADLLAYLRALEASPQRLLWGGLQFKVEQHPTAVLTLRVYTLSLDGHWLEI